MSLSRNQEENNYWPSISDMFLVFFVLTLALASTMIKAQQDGDKFVQDDVISEAALLVEFIRSTPDKTGKRVLIPWPEIPKNDARQLAMAVRKSREWVMANQLNEGSGNIEAIQALIKEDEEADFPDTNVKLDGVPGTLAWSSMGRNIKAMYLALDLGKADDVPNLYYDKMLREVNNKLNRSAGKPTHQQETDSLKTKCDTLQKTIDEQKRTIAEQKRTIAEQKRTIDEQKRTIDEQKDTIAKLQDTIAEQKHTIDDLQDKNEELTKQLKELQDENKKLVDKNARISTIVMSDDDVKFKKGKYNDEHNGDCKINNIKLATLVEEIKKMQAKNGAIIVEVIGHTDPEGGDEMNALLGLKRAQFFQGKIQAKLGTNENIIYRTYSAASSDQLGSDDASRRIEVIIRPK